MPQWPYGTPEWEHLRARKLQENTLCEPCLDANRLIPATVVDHTVPISQGGPAFPTLDGLTSMCWDCHNRKTQGERTGKTFISKGADAQGMPIDRRHPFYGGAHQQVAPPRAQGNKTLRPAHSGTSKMASPSRRRRYDGNR
jgi:5-methylcytosine-specific restriction protein A